jgi:hypothetical protein
VIRSSLLEKKSISSDVIIASAAVCGVILLSDARRNSAGELRANVRGAGKGPEKGKGISPIIDGAGNMPCPARVAPGWTKKGRLRV